VNKRITARVKKGKEDVIYLSPKGKVGLVANDYRKLGKPLPQPGEVWDVEIIYEAETFFIAMPITLVDNDAQASE
jgi:hypothetical protein